MSLADKLTMVIHSCNKFSDLWDTHVQLLEENWPDRNIPTYILTDCESEKKYPNVSILSAGEGKELSQRTAFALEQIKTEFVLITLDDYFLIKPVASETITGVLDMMDAENFDYVRLYLRPKCKEKNRIKKYGKVYHIDTNDRYCVNLYVGIWRKSFLEKTIGETKNAWQYEVSLPRIAREVGARCAMSNNDEFVILDVVRKGKLLHKANRYLKKRNLYHGDRPVISYWDEIKLGIRTWGIRIMPKWVTRLVRSFMIKLGHHYYSQDE